MLSLHISHFHIFELKEVIFITFYNQLFTESQRLIDKINSINSKLKHFPPGKLICSRNGKYFNWFVRTSKGITHLPKSQKQLAEQLAQKKYLTTVLEDLSHEQKAIQLYLDYLDSHPGQANLLLSDSSAYKELLSSSFLPLSEELLKWSRTPYKTNPAYPENLVFKTISGHTVRSKSESMIALLLYQNKIPFRYECILQLTQKTLYPDFTIRHPKTGKIYYWEHFGMIDKPDYRNNMLSSLRAYTSNGIYPSIQLLTTFETNDHPLDLCEVENIINRYFL